MEQIRVVSVPDAEMGPAEDQYFPMTGQGLKDACKSLRPTTLLILQTNDGSELGISIVFRYLNDELIVARLRSRS